MSLESTPRRPTMVPFLILGGVSLACGILFFQLIRPLLLPLFVAAVLAMLFHPYFERLSKALGDRPNLAASLMLLLAMVAIVVPIGCGLYVSINELVQAVDKLQGPETRATLQSWVGKYPWIDDMIENVQADHEQVREWALQAGAQAGKVLYARTISFLGNLPNLAVALTMFIIALFYFLRDGRRILQAWEDLTPMDAEHDRVLRTEFFNVCQGVVWGTIVAAVAQGVLFGVGLAIVNWIFQAHLGGWIFLLSLLTMAAAMIPLVGAAIVWLPTCVVLFLADHHAAALVLAVYSAVVVSTADNVVKIVVIQGKANLHPLLVFLSVFGGVELVGFLGIFIGPLIGAVLFALLRILKKELILFSTTEKKTREIPRVS